MKITKTVLMISFLFSTLTYNYSQTGTRLFGFRLSPNSDEQVMEINYNPEIRIVINASSKNSFDSAKPTAIALFALPNGNTIEQTIGKTMEPGDDWHFDIQHIGAQTRFLRSNFAEYNLVTVYLETTQKSWPSWKAKYANHHSIVNSVVDSLLNMFKDYNPSIVLTGHSGGGRFTFSFLDSVTEIPEFVKRITFLDSNYGYEHIYGDKIISWLKKSDENKLCVIAYNDSVALYNGQPIVSATGGTWYRSKMMQSYFSNHFSFAKDENDEFINFSALSGRVKILLKKNPERKILHTVQVERNGFIHGMLTGTPNESNGYVYYGDRIYSNLIQPGITMPKILNIPDRPADAMTGSAFMKLVENMSFSDREERIYQEISKGNIPDFLRSLVPIKRTFNDLTGTSHTVSYEVMPDYLSIGSNDDYCRIPMGPITAQKAANLFGAVMPTKKLVDNIYIESEIKLAPVTYTPVGNQNELVPKFVEHNSAIQNQFISARGIHGQLIGGTKKDIVISNKIVDPARTHHVTIYGWHQLNGQPIQPLTNIHIDTYTDYSHGIRFLNSEFLLDNKPARVQDILKDGILYKILSDESEPMNQPSYLKIEGLPDKPNSVGTIRNGSNSIKLLLRNDPNVETISLWLSKDGINMLKEIQLSAGNPIIENLDVDSLYFFKFKSVNIIGSSVYSELLSFKLGSTEESVLIVNAFDRATAGNTYDFIKQHAAAFSQGNISIYSCTNESIIDGLIDLTNYKNVIYILGEESTVDETFNSVEQDILKSFLKIGGNLFLSGSEIAWDLDFKGSTDDKSFFNNYLKSEYIADAPNNVSGTYYSVEPISSAFSNGLPRFDFDNGAHGTYNVKWPDVIKPLNGGGNLLRYSALNQESGVAGAYFQGTFPDGNKEGKLVYLGFPFETIYNSSVRINLAQKVLNFFDVKTDVEFAASTLPGDFVLYQNYPNPRLRYS
ncbi:MAG: hypothetical protein ABIJ40_07110 [Bacteroidota bacterium]